MNSFEFQLTKLITEYLESENAPKENVYQHITSMIDEPIIQSVLLVHEFNRSATAQALGISRGTLLKKIRRRMKPKRVAPKNDPLDNKLPAFN